MRDIKNICIVGGGNIGHYMAALMGSKDGYSVSVLCSDAHLWGDTVTSHDTQHDVDTVGKLVCVSSNPADVIPQADLIVSTVPSHGFPAKLEMIRPYITPGTVVGSIPGTGGVELLCKDLLEEKDCVIFGTQRVPSGTKIRERGKIVDSLGSRKDLRLAAIPSSKTDALVELFGYLLEIDTIPVYPYLGVTLTPSNPILHTSRLSTLLKDYKPGMVYDHRLSFYKEWSMESSERLIGSDDELREFCNLFEEGWLDDVISLKVHYEIDGAPGNTDIERMTNKIQSLVYLKDFVPMVEVEGGFAPDLNSRYFQEDFLFGLCIIKSFLYVTGIDCPHIDATLRWYENLFDKKLYAEDGSFTGPDLAGLPLPQNYGLTSIETIKEFYAALG